ncbi:MAG: ferredoxin [Planctomycetota bacterium]|nr:MAG: ferredoxin [Planctomycetota bacterium]
MGGVNPYIKQSEVILPKQPYRMVFLVGGEERAVEVDPAALPYTEEGLAGSVLDVACGHGIDIDHACGGVCACSTCHVLIEHGAGSCSELHEGEEDMLDLAPGLTDASRLACQCVPDGSEGVIVVVPDWNRNAASEAPH